MCEVIVEPLLDKRVSPVSPNAVIGSDAMFFVRLLDDSQVDILEPRSRVVLLEQAKLKFEIGNWITEVAVTMRRQGCQDASKLEYSTSLKAYH